MLQPRGCLLSSVSPWDLVCGPGAAEVAVEAVRVKYCQRTFTISLMAKASPHHHTRVRLKHSTIKQEVPSSYQKTPHIPCLTAVSPPLTMTPNTLHHHNHATICHLKRPPRTSQYLRRTASQPASSSISPSHAALWDSRVGSPARVGGVGCRGSLLPRGITTAVALCSCIDQCTVDPRGC